MFELFMNNFEKIIGGIMVAVFGGYVAYRTYRKTRFNQASDTFKSRVIAELEGLYPIPTNWPREKMMIDRILREKFPRLQTTIAEFRGFLPWYRRKAFDEAWFVYRLGKDGREIDNQDYWQYIPSSGASMANDVLVQHDNTQTFQENFKQNIDNLLKFAKHT